MRKKDQFLKALSDAIAEDDPIQKLYGFLVEDAYVGIEVERIVTYQESYELVKQVERNLETARKSLDSLCKRQSQIVQGQTEQTETTFKVGFLVDDSLPDDVLDPYVPEAG